MKSDGILSEVLKPTIEAFETYENLYWKQQAIIKVGEGAKHHVEIHQEGWLLPPLLSKFYSSAVFNETLAYK